MLSKRAGCSSVPLLCSGAALYEMTLQRELAMRDAEALAQLQLVQEERRLDHLHQHAAETAQVQFIGLCLDPAHHLLSTC